MNPVQQINPDWRWDTAGGSRELDRLLDQRLAFLEKLQWPEEAEDLALAFQTSREKSLAERTKGK